MAKHVTGTHPILLSFAHLLGIGLWGSAFAPILTVGIWSGQETQLRRRFEADGGPTLDLLQGVPQLGPLLGCMIGGILITYVFLCFFFHFLFFPSGKLVRLILMLKGYCFCFKSCGSAWYVCIVDDF